MKYINLFLCENIAGKGHGYKGYINDESLDLAGIEPLKIYSDKEGKKLLALIPTFAIYLVEFSDAEV